MEKHLPKRLLNPLWRAKNYIELQAGMPDPVKEARLAREAPAATTATMTITQPDSTRGPAPFGGGGGSLSLVDTWTFSGVASTVRDGVLTTAFDDYLLVLSNLAVNNTLYLRFRVAGSDSTTGYYSGYHFVDSAGTASGPAGVTNSTNGIELMPSIGSASDALACIWISRPKIADYTMVRADTSARWTTGSWVGWAGGMHNVQTAYDGLAVRVSTGTITGTGRLYGLKN